MTIVSPCQGFWCERLDDEMVMDGGEWSGKKAVRAVWAVNLGRKTWCDAGLDLIYGRNFVMLSGFENLPPRVVL